MRTGVSWLDFKLGLRMLVKYPGLTLVGGLAVAFAIWVGAGTFEFVTQVVRPTLPLDGGGRIVGVQNWDAAASRMNPRALHDFHEWREELRTVDDLGAFRTLERNLITGEGRGEPVEVAEMSASGFRVARVPPLLGRHLVEADEQPGAAPVVVLGHEVWTTRFDADPGVVGTQVRLGNTVHTVAGVMPEGFAFPVAQSLWVPLRLDPAHYERGEGPAIRVFGRLAPGASLDDAQTEAAALGRRAAADHPATHEHLRPRVLPYARSILNLSVLESAAFMSGNLFLVMLLVLVCANVALLMFARAASRESEIVVRNALGASRGRIMAQLFAEALVLMAVATAVGLAAAGWGLRWGYGIVLAEIEGRRSLPFWFSPTLSPATVVYAVLLALLGALIAGVVPALKVTRGIESRLRRASAGGGGFRFGGVWTAVIVTQVAVTVTFPVVAFYTQRSAAEVRTLDVGFPDHEYLAVRLEMDREPAPGAPADTSEDAFTARFAASAAELERRLEADPAVAGVTLAEYLPRMYHPHRRVEVEGPAVPPPDSTRGHRVGSARVALDFFDVVDAPILAGRGFHSGDLAEEARTVIANQSFVELVLGGRNPIGRRVRYVEFEEEDGPRAEPGPWHEIVGIVRDMGMSRGDDPKVAGFYHPAAPGTVHPAQMAVHVRGDPQAFVPRLRATAAAVDPSLRLHGVMALADAGDSELKFLQFWFWLTVVVSGVALLLSLAGIYSVMSFTVAQRTREIGIRVALGADARRVVAAIFRRPLTQVAFGILAGLALVAALLMSARGGMLPPGQVAIVLAYALLMMAVCLVACLVPTRRALRIQPTEALKAE